ncbi:NAD(P)-dependent oxidoreductase [Flavobacterium suzhouense]|uniref:NAD(P)-dependent oxidoreductase n=1 Tax=Flavobacterium suzhouense TaxID=1529638 RepID=A0ABW5NTA6_9FLAO
MKPTIKIAVIGGTGKAGSFLIKELKKQHIKFKAMVRNPENSNFSPEQFLKGNVSDYETVVSLLKDCDVVISMLGMGTSSNPSTIFTTATANIIKAMGEANIKRYIVITGLNVDTPSDDKGEKSKMATGWMMTHYPETTKNKQQEYELLVKSDLDWTMVRLPMIMQTDEKPEINISLLDCPGDAISATSLAKFVIDQIDDPTYIRKAPFIANI